MRQRRRLLWRRLRSLGATSADNEVTLFPAGTPAMRAMVEAIDAAKARVWCETYILLDDRVGRLVVDALRRAAERGVEVRLLYDAVGSLGLSSDFVRPLEEAGGEVRAFNPLLARRLIPKLMRNHRKVLVVDSAVGFTGGMNLSDDYAEPPLGNGRFRDTHLRVRGPAVAELARIFQGSWREETRERLALPGRAAPAGGGVQVQVLASNTHRGRREIQAAARRAVGNAQGRAWFTSPYFVPPRRLARGMIRAAQRGVDVRVLTAGVSDVPIVRRASRHLYGRLLRGGVRIFELYSATLHAKTWVVDDDYGQVGSFNLDRWSWRRNLEVSFGWFDEALTRALADHFHADLEGAEECELEAWAGRGPVAKLVDWLAYQLLRW